MTGLESMRSRRGGEAAEHLGERWGGVIHCAECGVGCRTNVAAYLDGTEAWVCIDCTWADEWSEDQDEHEALVDAAQVSDVLGMTRLL